MPRQRAYARAIFLRLLGVIFLIAFLSLRGQVLLLFGSHGLLPAARYLEAVRPTVTALEAPTMFWLDCRDQTLWAAAGIGALLSCGLILNLAPFFCLVALWLLYLSFVTIGQDFLSFQWDNLLLESAFFALFITPVGLRPRRPPAPHPIGVLLMLWLLFRLHVESGAAKLLSGDPTWRDLTAMVNYYETAPLPTWLGWYAHQMPLWGHKLCALFTFVVELGVPLALWGPSALRAAAFVLMVTMQVSVILTANYGFFNYLTMALCFFVLDDRQLGWVAQRCGVPVSPPPARPASAIRTLLLGLVAAGLVALSVVPFLPFLSSRATRAAQPVERLLSAVRSLNAYHLFANMTLIRREPIIEGSDDGETWQPYEFYYKPGNPDGAPPFVAPHQPRVDFQLWFLLLGRRIQAPYFDHLLQRMVTAPEVVAPLFRHNPFPEHPPRFLRVAVYRYRFTGPGDSAWWRRDLLGTSTPIDILAVRPEGS